MLRVSRMADYGMTLMFHLSQTGPTSAHRLSELSKLPYPTVAKVLKNLSSGRVLSSRRGVHGGYTMTRALSDITVYEVVCAIDGPLHLAVQDPDESPAADWSQLAEQIESLLKTTSVEALMASPGL